MRPLAATLLAEEGIVEVGAIDHHVVVNAALTVDRDLVAIGPVRRSHRGQGHQIEEIASIVRQPCHGIRVEARRDPGAPVEDRCPAGYFDDFAAGHMTMLTMTLVRLRP